MRTVEMDGVLTSVLASGFVLKKNMLWMLDISGLVRETRTDAYRLVVLAKIARKWMGCWGLI